MLEHICKGKFSIYTGMQRCGAHHQEYRHTAVFIIRSVSTSVDYQADRISPFRSVIWKHSGGPGFTVPHEQCEYLVALRMYRNGWQ